MSHWKRNIWLAIVFVGLGSPPHRTLADEDVSRARLSPKAASVLREPSNLELYLNPVTERDEWKIAAHGLRNAPLDPRVWGARKDQRTESHRLIPIKHYYLRSSEQPDYRIDRVSIQFSFWPARASDVLRNPHEKDAIIEFGFGGELVLQPGGREPIRDRGYVMRISGLPFAPSGLLYQSKSHTVMLQPGPQIRLKRRSLQHLEGKFSDSKVTFSLNGTRIAELDAPGVNRGLVSLINGWHPLNIVSLEIEGHQDGKKQLRESGLVSLAQRKAKKDEVGPQGNEVLDKTLFREQSEYESSEEGSSSE